MWYDRCRQQAKFSTCRLKWPFAFDEVNTPSHVHCDGMFLREQEVLVFLDTFWPPSAAYFDFCFCDINPTLLCVVDSCMENGWPKLKTEDPLALSPWQTRCRTQVGSGKMIVRHRMAFHNSRQRPKSFAFDLWRLSTQCERLDTAIHFGGGFQTCNFRGSKICFIGQTSQATVTACCVYGRYMEDHQGVVDAEADRDEQDGERASSEDVPSSVE